MVTMSTPAPEIMTPEQAAEYLQVSRETIYRLLRDGRLLASKIGRQYRIPKENIDVLLWATGTWPDITLRDYTAEQIAEFIELDKLDPETEAIARRFTEVTGRS